MSNTGWTIRNDSGEGRGRRAPVCLHAKLANASGIPAGAGCVSINDQCCAGRSNGRGEGCRCRCGHGRWKLRAAGRSVERRARMCVLGGVLIRAVVRSMAPAAEREARLVNPGQDSRKGPKPEKQDQRDGKYAPHSPYRLKVSWHQNTNSTIPKCWSGMIES